MQIKIMNFLKPKGKKGRLGLSFTDSHVAVVALRHMDGEPPVVDVASVHQISVLDKHAMRSMVSQLAVKSMPCNALLNVDQYQILQVDKPNMPDAEIKPSLKWKVKELLDYHVEQATVDGVEIPVDPANPNRLPLMFAVCAKNTVLSEVSNQLVDAGLNLKSIDVQAMAQRNLAALLETESRALAMISVLDRGCLVTFTSGGELFHTRFIELDRGFALDQLGTLFASNMERLILELQRSLDSFDRQFPYLSVNKLLVAPDASAQRLADVLKSSLYVPVEVFDLQQVVKLPVDQDFSSPEKQSMILPALGAALRVEENA